VGFVGRGGCRDARSRALRRGLVRTQGSRVGQLTVRQYDALERAIVDATRIAVLRRGTEYVVIPERLITHQGAEAIVARHPTTGARLTLRLDELDRLEVVR